VLVIDDVESTRQRLVQTLSAGGYRAIPVRNGLEAFDVLMSSPPVDAIVLDLVMPGMNGWEFRDVQLRDPRLASIPTVVLTVKSLADHERYALRVGSGTVVHKPFEDAEVLEALNRARQNRTTAPAGTWKSSEGHALFWSRRGDVACETHAPVAGSGRWRDEGWAVIPSGATRNRVEYRCQYCDGGPIRHRGTSG
jgi:CheY-like chemotaxis protein